MLHRPFLRRQSSQARSRRARARIHLFATHACHQAGESDIRARSEAARVLPTPTGAMSGGLRQLLPGNHELPPTSEPTSSRRIPPSSVGRASPGVDASPHMIASEQVSGPHDLLRIMRNARLCRRRSSCSTSVQGILPGTCNVRWTCRTEGHHGSITLSFVFLMLFFAATFFVVLRAIVFTPPQRSVRPSPAWPPGGARRNMTAPRARRWPRQSPTLLGHRLPRGGR